jgi:diaminopimelate decarboxylase
MAIEPLEVRIEVTRIDESLSIRGRNLFMEDCDTVEIARQFGTPVFVVSEDHLRRNVHRYQSAFAACWPEGPVDILPAFKAAPYLATRRILSDVGTGCDTFGAAELEGALRCRTNPAMISVNGSIKTPDVIRRGIDIGARIVIDAPREMQICAVEAAKQNKSARVMLRLKPDLAGLKVRSDFAPKSVRELTQMLRYGIPTNEILPLGAHLDQLTDLKLIGFHCHIGRYSTDQRVWKAYVNATIALIAELREAWDKPGWTPEIIDFGGGFAPPRNFDTDHGNRGGQAPDIETYAETILTELRAALIKHKFEPNGLRVAFEPGRGLHSDTGLHLSTVANIKHSTGRYKRSWAEVDTSEQFLGTYAMDPSDPPFNFRVANRAHDALSETFDIVGKSCGGEMILLDAKTPMLKVGDIIALLDTGAYIETLACNFNALPRPGVVLVSGEEAEWIKRPETIDEVYARDVVPGRFMYAVSPALAVE